MHGRDGRLAGFLPGLGCGVQGFGEMEVIQPEFILVDEYLCF